MRKVMLAVCALAGAAAFTTLGEVSAAGAGGDTPRAGQGRAVANSMTAISEVPDQYVKLFRKAAG